MESNRQSFSVWMMFSFLTDSVNLQFLCTFTFVVLGVFLLCNNNSSKQMAVVVPFVFTLDLRCCEQHISKCDNDSNSNSHNNITLIMALYFSIIILLTVVQNYNTMFAKSLYSILLFLYG